MHPPPQLLAQRALLERRHPERRHQIAPAQLGQHARVDLVGLARQRRDVAHLARVRDVDPPTDSRELIADPDRAAHHLDARANLGAERHHEPRQAVRIGRNDTLAADRAALTERAPRRPPIRPIDPDILHRGASLTG